MLVTTVNCLTIQLRCFCCVCVVAWGLVALPINAADDSSKLLISSPTPQVYVGDQVLIDVEATAVADEIDFSVLFKDLTLERQTYGTRIAVIKGKVVEVRIWRFEAVASTPGEFVLGPITAGELVSNVVHASVEPAPEVRWTPTDNDVKFTVEWSKPELYVQQQLLLTIKVQYQYPIVKLDIREPDLKAFRVITLVKDRRTQQDTSAGRESTFLKRYALFARSSGELNIGAFEARGEIIKSRLERAPFHLSSAPQTIQVRPAPTDHKGSWWLPALDVTAREEWSKDKRWLAAGEQVQRSAIIEASGVSADQLPDINMPDAKGLRISFIDSERQTIIHDNGVSATARFNFNVRALSPIPVFPDPIPVHWWNTREDAQATAFIRTGRIDIGAPSREAMLEIVEQERSSFDWLALHKTKLWLAALLMTLLTGLLQWRINRTLISRRLITAYRWCRCRLADARLKRASRQDDKQFLGALQQWKQVTGFQPVSEGAHSLNGYLRSVYAAPSFIGKDKNNNDTLRVARLLVSERRAR